MGNQIIDIFLIIEIASVLFGLAFIILIILEIKWGWLFGILSSILSIALFLHTKLYFESILYSYYVLIGIYGWYTWTNTKEGTSLKISEWGLHKHLITIGIGVLLAFGLGHLSKSYTDANNPYFDATTTIFSFIASYLEAQKILSGWIYWILINGATIWLYHLRGLNFYSVLIFIYFISSFVGYYSWRKKMIAQAA